MFHISTSPAVLLSVQRSGRMQPYIVRRDIRESMKVADVEIILQRAKERAPDARPGIISDNGPQFIAKDFKEFIRVSGMTHVRTAPYYPQSNGKVERWHGTLKRERIRPSTPLSLDVAPLREPHQSRYFLDRLRLAPLTASYKNTRLNLRYSVIRNNPGPR
jgi:transposase InsO family protein